MYTVSTFYGARDSGDQNRAFCDRACDRASFELGALEAGEVGQCSGKAKTPPWIQGCLVGRKITMPVVLINATTSKTYREWKEVFDSVEEQRKAAGI
ncbi:MAG: hypothetical protein CL790_00665 [Chloroflexi bacterium]|nr:hypothetical protein [Chloroflexota bacterium]HCU72629.1 hypothetical protein [Chloroflexota bacterium]